MTPGVLVAVVILGALAGMLLPSGAHAGEYSVWSCRGPAGEPLSMKAWRVEAFDAGPGEVNVAEDCTAGGRLNLEVTGVAVTGNRKPSAVATFRLPDGGRIVRYRFLRYVQAAGSFPGSGYFYIAAVRETASGGGETEWGCASGLAPPNFNCSSSGSPTDPDDPGNEFAMTGDFAGLEAYAACATINCQATISGPGATFRMYGAEVVIEDNDLPTVTELTGPVARGDAVSGTTGLFVGASDQGAGLSTMSLSVDGDAPQTLEAGGAACEPPYEVPEPCPGQTGRMFEIDTATLSEGEHTASGQVTDAAGNVTQFGPLDFTVDRSVPPPPPEEPDNGTPATNAASIDLKGSKLRAARGKAAVLRGRLSTPAGQPVAGAKLVLESTEAYSGLPRVRPLGSVTTGSDGRFTRRIKPDGARIVSVSFSPRVGGPAAEVARVMVKSRLKLKMKRKPKRVKKGKAVRFTGRLAGAGRAAPGANVEIQAISAGKWRTVANVSARKNGRFVWRYRFRFVERDAIFSFRAVVKRTPGWPWGTVRSKRIKVFIDA
jgi:hypothetical protein